MKNEQLMTSVEVAKYFKLNVHTIYRMVRDGRIPLVEIGGSVRFKKEDLDAFFKSKTKAKRRKKCN